MGDWVGGELSLCETDNIHGMGKISLGNNNDGVMNSLVDFLPPFFHSLTQASLLEEV